MNVKCERTPSTSPITSPLLVSNEPPHPQQRAGSGGTEYTEGGGHAAGGGAVQALPGGLAGRPDGAHGHRALGVGAQAQARGSAGHGNRVLLPTWQQSFVANGRAIRKDARETMALLKALPDCVGQDLLEAVLDLTAYGASCLYISAENGQLDVVNAMLEAGGLKTVIDVVELFFRC